MMIKVTSMDAFTDYAITDGITPLPDYNDVILPKIQILTATSAANCGISSNSLRFAMHKGLPSTLYDVLQEMGCVDRKCSAEPGTNFYEVHINLALRNITLRQNYVRTE